MKNIFLKYFVLMAVFLFISGCMEEKEVQGPIPYTPTKATQINKNDPNTFYGAYLVSNFEPKNNNIVGLDNFTGGFFISYDALSNQLQYKYALKYGGYDNQYTSAKLAYSNEFQTIPDYEIAEDNYTIILNTPIEISADSMTYKINSITKNDDIVTETEMTEVMKLDNLTINHTTKLCDPAVSDGSENDCTNAVGAMKYIGYYRMDEIICGNNTYYGGRDFAGEMTASADLTSLVESSIVKVPISIKFQVNNEELKTCILSSEQIRNNNLYFEEPIYNISLEDGLLLDRIFSNVGLLGIQDGTEHDRTSYITYKPKELDFTDKLFNNNQVQIKLRIMQQQKDTSSNIIPAPVTLTNNPYWQATSTAQ